MDNLLNVLKPARYIGNEVNIVIKDKENKVNFLFAFPDVYEIGMSYLGLHTIYYFLNEKEDVYCQLAFAPAQDYEDIMRSQNIPLTSLTEDMPAKDFDIIGFTLPYEMGYTNVLNMLNLAQIPLLSSERGEEFPVICAGGICAVNPLPLNPFIDFFYVGEAEVTLHEITDIKKNSKTKTEFLENIKDIVGIYVPAIHKTDHVIKRAYVKDLNESFVLNKQLIPLIDVVHNRASLEIFRGCMRGCRFCQSGYITRPKRERNQDILVNQACELIRNSGYEELSLVSLSTSDYKDFYSLANNLNNSLKAKNVKLSLPSLRVDTVGLELLSTLSGERKGSITMAPEAGSQRMRNVINKNLTHEEIINSVEQAFEAGYSKLKFYFMTGLPLETESDLKAIAELSKEVVNMYYKPNNKKRPLNLTVSSACFVPKPHTPFQFVQQNNVEEFFEKHHFIKDEIGAKNKHIKYKYHNPKVSVIEGVLARGDEKIAQVLLEVHKLGAKFDSWDEHFDFDRWMQAFENVGLKLEDYLKGYDVDAPLPWDFIDVGLTRRFFVNEYQKAQQELTTPNCDQVCSACGIACFNI